MGQDPQEDDRKEIDRLQEVLSNELDILEGLRHRVTTEVYAPDNSLPPGNPAAFDNLETDSAVAALGEVPPVTQATASVAVPEIVPPEARRLSIPSRWESRDNIYRAVELRLRISQADRTLQALRNTIADKSFQYSHIMRVAPRKAVRTRARTAIAKLNFLITYYSRVYGECRTSMVQLGADNITLNKYQTLQKDDVKSSTALLNPNEPGSTRVQLSWIWQTLPGSPESQPEILQECEY